MSILLNLNTVIVYSCLVYLSRTVVRGSQLHWVPQPHKHSDESFALTSPYPIIPALDFSKSYLILFPPSSFEGSFQWYFHFYPSITLYWTWTIFLFPPSLSFRGEYFSYRMILQEGGKSEKSISIMLFYTNSQLEFHNNIDLIHKENKDHPEGHQSWGEIQGP